MSAARDPLPFDPVSIGADWDFDIEFFLGDESQPEDISANEVRIALAKRVSPPRALAAYEVFELTLDNGLSVALNTVTARIPGAATSDYSAGVYEAEVWMTRPDGGVESVLTFIQPIVKGAGATAAGDVAGPPPMTGGRNGVWQIFRDPNRYRVVRAERGVRGPAGSAIATLTRVAGVALSGHRCVIATAEGLFDYPDTDVAGEGPLIVGITTGAAAEGYEATAQTQGLMEDDSFAFTVGPVFCGPGGELVQTLDPDAAFIRQVAVAIAPDALQIDLSPAILAAD